MRIHLPLLLLIPGMLFLSCTKEEWTRPVKVAFSFSMDEMESTSGKKSQTYLEFHEGKMNISQISFEGYRETGPNVFFDSDFESPVLADLATVSSEPPVVFDIPQGIYDHINITLELDSEKQPFSLELRGVYHSPNPHKGDIPVIFTLDLPEKIEVNPRPSAETGEIAFVKDRHNEIRICLHTDILVQLIYSAMLESADFSGTEENPCIVISGVENENIYLLIMSRLEKATEGILMH